MLKPILFVVVAGAVAYASSSSAMAATPTPVTAPADSVVYTVRPGESLYVLAGQYFLHRSDYRVVQRANRIANPLRIPVGTVLHIPVAVLRAAPLVAKVAAFHGAVRLTSGGRDLAPAAGAELAAGAVIETGGDGFVTLALPNGSRTSIPTHSRLRIVNLRRFILTGDIDYDLAVDAGKVETKATPLGPGSGSFRVRTPRVVTAVRGTQFRVGLENDSSLAEVLEGTVGTGTGNAAATPIHMGFGAVVSKTGALSSEALLPAPELVQPGRVQVDPLVHLALAGQAVARGYHVQVAKDAGFGEIVAEARSTAPAFELPGIPNGALFVRISAFAPSGLEGMAQTYAMRRVLTGLSASASADADGMRFKWSGEGEGRRTYHFQLVRADRRDVPVVDEPGLAGDEVTLRDLGPGTYFWRVGVRQASGADVTENWLPFEKLIVAAPEG